MPPHLFLEYFEPPPHLSRYILATFWFAADVPNLVDKHPGAFGQLFINPHGRGLTHFDDHSDIVQPGANLFSGFSPAAPFHMEGPWHVIGASLSPFGWAALTGASSGEHYNRVLPAEDLLGPDIAEFSAAMTKSYLDGRTTGEQACHDLADWIGKRLKPIHDPHDDLIGRTIEWLSSSLNPVIDELISSSSYSRRQTERLVERYLGLPPAALARKYRAMRAASLLSQESLSDEAEAEIATAFVDQPHMIREIRTFCGYTPSRLGGLGDPIFHNLVQMKYFDRLEQFRALR